jgi:hypothetical protein
MSISWGLKERFKFSGGGSLSHWDPPPVAGIFTITCKQNMDRPKAHSILFVGQAEDISSEAREQSGQVVEAWRTSGQNLSELFVFVHPMPGSSRGERTKVVEQLVAEYRPQCNR